MLIDRALQILDEARPQWSWTSLREKSTENMFEALSLYVAEHGDCQVPPKYKTASGLPLGKWLESCRERGRAGTLAPETLRRLRAFKGFELSPVAAERDARIARIKEYIQKHGKLPDALYLDETGFRLGSWMGSVRSAYHARKLAEDTKKAVETIPGWDWATSQRPDIIESIYAKLRAKPDGWFEELTTEEMKYRQGLRRRCKNGKSPTKAQMKLAQTPGFLEHVRDRDRQREWDDSFKVAFRLYRKYAYFPSGSESASARWLYEQRWSTKNGLVPPDRLAQLETLPFWKKPIVLPRGWRNIKWMRSYNELKTRVVSKMNLPIRSKESLYAFCWKTVKQRRENQGSLDVETTKLLESIPGWSWDGNHAFTVRQKGK